MMGEARTAFAYGIALVLAAGAAAALLAIHERQRWREMVSPLWVNTDHDIAYGPLARQRLDILRARWSASGPRPMVVVYHGGAWTTGDREEMLVRVCHRYLAHGFVVANVEYRLGSISAAVEDATLALEWICRHTSQYGVDRRRIVATGESAGGHLALMAAFRSHERPLAVVNFYGISDLTPLLQRPEIRDVLSGNREAEARALSPLTYVRSGLPAVLSIHGTADPLIPISQTEALTSALRQAGSEAYEVAIESVTHGFTEGQQELAYKSVFDFLRRRGIAQ
jgi:acetyl esterase/lipase